MALGYSQCLTLANGERGTAVRFPRGEPYLSLTEWGREKRIVHIWTPMIRRQTVFIPVLQGPRRVARAEMRMGVVPDSYVCFKVTCNELYL